MKAMQSSTNSAPFTSPTSLDSGLLNFTQNEQQYSIHLQCLPHRLAWLSGLKPLAHNRNTDTLGLFAILFAGLALTILSLGEGLQSTLLVESPNAPSNAQISQILAMTLPMVDIVIWMTWLALLAMPVVLAALLGISLGQAFRAPRAPSLPRISQERTWLLVHGEITAGQLRLQPDQMGLRLDWLFLEPAFRKQGLGQEFVRRVLQAEIAQAIHHQSHGQDPSLRSITFRCRVKSPSKSSGLKQFWSDCGFQHPEENSNTRPGVKQSLQWVRQLSSRPRQQWMLYHHFHKA